ncbi:hypothetical protein Tco_1573849, partial [Tanacetum coccineum]
MWKKLKNTCQEDPGTRLEPRRDKESSKVKKSGDVLIIHDDEEEEKSPRTHIAPISSDKETLQELTVTTQDASSSSDKEKLKELTVDSFLRNYMPNNILYVYPTQAPKSSAQDLQDHEDHYDDDAHPKGGALRRDYRRNQEQLDEFDAWMDDFGIDDDEDPNEEVSQELFEEISREIDEAQLQ